MPVSEHGAKTTVFAILGEIDIRATGIQLYFVSILFSQKDGESILCRKW